MRRMSVTGLMATLLCLVSLWSCTTNVQTDDAQQEVLTAHEKRRLATLNRDANTVASMMTDDLTFTHANAVVETKEQFVDALKTLKLQYKTLTDEDLQVLSAVSHFTLTLTLKVFWSASLLVSWSAGLLVFNQVATFGRIIQYMSSSLPQATGYPVESYFSP